jgi:hypothetical protein
LFEKGLNRTSEYDKWGSTVATTILTLLPTILTYAPLPSADINELYCLDRSMAFWASAMTFALPIEFKRITPPGHKRYLKARDLLAETNGPQSLSDFHFAYRTSRTLKAIQTAVCDSKPPIPTYKAMLVACGFIFIQASLLPVVSSLVWNLDTFSLIWLCPDQTFFVIQTWLYGVSVIVGLISSGWLQKRIGFKGQHIFHLFQLPVGIRP